MSGRREGARPANVCGGRRDRAASVGSRARKLSLLPPSLTSLSLSLPTPKIKTAANISTISTRLRACTRPLSHNQQRRSQQKKDNNERTMAAPQLNSAAAALSPHTPSSSSPSNATTSHDNRIAQLERALSDKEEALKQLSRSYIQEMQSHAAERRSAAAAKEAVAAARDALKAAHEALEKGVMPSLAKEKPATAKSASANGGDKDQNGNDASNAAAAAANAKAAHRGRELDALRGQVAAALDEACSAASLADNIAATLDSYVKAAGAAKAKEKGGASSSSAPACRALTGCEVVDAAAREAVAAVEGDLSPQIKALRARLEKAVLCLLGSNSKREGQEG